MVKVKDIKRRIKSVGNTKKITKAMEMVAAAKMRRALETVLRTRTYANLSWETVLNLSRAADSGGRLHPLLQKKKKIKKIGIILFASNRGLCGGFNAAIVNKAHESIKKHHKMGEPREIKTKFIIVGKRGAAVHKYYNYDIIAEFPKSDAISEVKEVIPVARMVISDFLAGKYDKIMVAYTDFINAAKQAPRVKQLLPIDFEAHDAAGELGILGKDPRVGLSEEFIREKAAKHLRDKKNVFVYTFEPNPEEVLNEMIPRLIEIQLYQALLEANASEHSARVAAMHKATEAAGDLIGELTLFYNKTRQANITAEIAEISAGANALR